MADWEIRHGRFLGEIIVLRKIGWQAVLFLGCVLLSAKINACYLGGGSSLGDHGSMQLDVFSNTGEKIGLIHRGDNERWEAIIFTLGALNESFTSANEALNAVCQFID